MSRETAVQVRDLVAKGTSCGRNGFNTAECRKTYQSLFAKGVEFNQEPVERPYGIDCALRDPFGNAILINQPIGPQT